MAILAILLPFLLLGAVAGVNPVIEPEPQTPLIEEEPEIDYRLPKNVVPVDYDITLQPDFKDFTFKGSSKITITVKEKTREIILHAKELNITALQVSSKATDGKVKFEVLRNPPFEHVKEKDFLVVKTANDLAVGTYTLSVDYIGTLNDKLRGFYRSKYLDKDNKERWLATTQFEAASARIAFPCWDEPALKAVFKITIKHPQDYSAISNTPGKTVNSTDPKNPIATTTFEPTPIMSTYLVAFVVSDYDKKVDDKLAVWTKPHAIADTSFALDHGKKVLKVLGDYLGIDYYSVMKKMDQISIPDFSAGAMENWGLVTYRESALLYNEKTTTTAAKQSIGSVIAHEFAHQWFGNLVSPAWWNHIWLNEGFADYFEYFAMHMVEKEWRMAEQFVVNAVQGRAFIVDGSEATHPINENAGSPNEISALFDAIAYQKGGAVIRMMEHALSEEIFKKGLTTYLDKMRFKAATSDDLFAYMQEAVKSTGKPSKDFDVKKVMSPWVTQAGYPIVNVFRDPTKKTVEISQHRYPIPASKSETAWYIPITYTTSKSIDFENTTAQHWLEPKANLKFDIPDADKDTWIVLNKQHTGYYRVNYDHNNWKLLTKHLKSQNFEEIIPVNRAQLIDNAFSLALIGELDYEIVLDLMTYLVQESDYIPWVPAFRGFDYLNKMLVNSKEYGKFKMFLSEQLKNATKTIGFEPRKEDTHIDKLARVNLIKWGCAMGLADCKTHVAKKLEAYLKDPAKTDLGVDLNGQILCGALRSASKESWDKLFKMYKDSKDKTEKQLLLSVLGCSESKEILESFASQIFNASTGIEDPATAFLSVIVNTPYGVDIGLATLEEQAKTIKAMNNGDALLKSFVGEIASRITTSEQQYKLGIMVVQEDFPKEASAIPLRNSYKNRHWLQKYEEPITKWLSKLTYNEKKTNDGGGASTTTIAAFLLILPVLVTKFF